MRCCDDCMHFMQLSGFPGTAMRKAQMPFASTAMWKALMSDILGLQIASIWAKLTICGGPIVSFGLQLLPLKPA